MNLNLYVFTFHQKMGRACLGVAAEGMIEAQCRAREAVEERFSVADPNPIMLFATPIILQRPGLKFASYMFYGTPKGEQL